jgi:hypothetical protein
VCIRDEETDYEGLLLKIEGESSASATVVEENLRSREKLRRRSRRRRSRAANQKQ